MKFVFDFAGVLFRWQPLQLMQRELPQRATDEASAAHWVAQVFEGYTGDWGDYDRGLVESPDLVQRIARRTGLAPAEVQRVVDAVPGELQALPESVALLRRLRDAGRELYFLSNMPAPVAAQLEAENSFIAWFSDGVFSARVREAKPDAAIFELAAARFGAAPRQLVFLDDTLSNVHAARALGWNALHFSSAARAEAELRERGWMTGA